MNKYAKQFDVINKIKTFVKITGRAIRSHGRHNEISEDIARKIQKSAYEYNQSPKKEEYTPPYKQIAKQLQVGDEQIYRGAVYTLAEIAYQQAQYRDEIVKILTQQLKNASVSESLKEYIEEKLAKL